VEPEPIIFTCKYCAYPISKESFYCPHCGKKLREKPASLGILSLLLLFVLSTFLPPLGLGMTIRYIKAEDKTAKIVGWISLVLTISAIFITILLAKSMFEDLNQQINSQMSDYKF